MNRLAYLEELIASMRKAVARGDQQEVSKADIAFHHTLVKASGNRMLEHVWQTLRLAITVFIINSRVHLSLHDLVERHVPILAALRAHDPIRAEAEMRKHIAEPAELILNTVKNKDAAEPKTSRKKAATAPKEVNPPQIPRAQVTFALPN